MPTFDDLLLAEYTQRPRRSAQHRRPGRPKNDVRDALAARLRALRPTFDRYAHHTDFTFTQMVRDAGGNDTGATA